MCLLVKSVKLYVHFNEGRCCLAIVSPYWPREERIFRSLHDIGHFPPLKKLNFFYTLLGFPLSLLPKMISEKKLGSHK